MKKIMILGGGEYQLPGIIKAKEMGLQVIVCDYYPDCVGKQVEGVIGELVSTYDYDGVLEAAKRHKIDAILTLCTDYPARVVAYVAENMGLPGISKADAIRATDKGKMRQCLSQHNVPSPKFSVVSDKSSFLNSIAKFNSTCVVKAVDNSGSRGIQLLSYPWKKDEAEKAYNYCQKYSRSGDVVIEEYMEGAEVCVETLNFGGECYPIQISAQFPKEPPYFTDVGYYQPAAYDEDMTEKIKKLAINANKALNIHTGSSCTEIIVTKDGPKIVEVGPRLAGDYMTSHLVPLSTGVDMVEGVIKIALGEEPDINRKFSRGSCIKYYMKQRVGKIKNIRGFEEAMSMEGCALAKALKNVGDMAVPLRASTDRIGFVMTEGKDAKEAINRCDVALNLVEVEVE